MSPLAAARRGTLGAVAALVATVGVAAAASAASEARAAPGPGAPIGSCTQRLLVLSAFPAELDAVLARATVDPTRTVTVEGRTFYLGRLGGNDVVMALTGIGLINATNTTQLALDHFGCSSGATISRVVFSGVAGGRTNIGDVTVPRRWTEDGKSWLTVDPSMLATARAVAESGSVTLERDVPVGDPGCVCPDPGLVKPVHMPNAPAIVVGGDGGSSDPFNGRAWPCAPQGGDVFGCEPCRAQTHSPDYIPRYVSGVVPFADPNFILSYFKSPPAPAAAYDAQDMETAAVARVATRNGLPFLGVRAVSDGKGDPLMLPGFPAQFFAYRVLAADNAAAMTVGFLKAWSQRSTQPAVTTSASATAPTTAPAVSALPNTSDQAGAPAAALSVAALTALLIATSTGRCTRRARRARSALDT
jgi:nucleoside phosphorylase